MADKVFFFLFGFPVGGIFRKLQLLEMKSEGMWNSPPQHAEYETYPIKIPMVIILAQPQRGIGNHQRYNIRYSSSFGAATTPINVGRNGRGGGGVPSKSAFTPLPPSQHRKRAEASKIRLSHRYSFRGPYCGQVWGPNSRPPAISVGKGLKER